MMEVRSISFASGALQQLLLPMSILCPCSLCLARALRILLFMRFCRVPCTDGGTSTCFRTLLVYYRGWRITVFSISCKHRAILEFRNRVDCLRRTGHDCIYTSIPMEGRFRCGPFRRISIIRLADAVACSKCYASPSTCDVISPCDITLLYCFPTKCPYGAMPFPPLRKSHSIDADAERRLSDALLHQPPVEKTSAQLRANHASGAAHARSALVPNTQARDAKPRLLLMGLRRLVYSC